MTTEFIKAQLYSPERVDILGIDSSKTHLLKIVEMKKRVGEILDCFTENLDNNGRLQLSKSGEIGKETAHNIGALHLASHIWIYNSRGEVLIQQRASNKFPFPNLWDFSAAGHIDSGEDFMVGGLRETEEEIGLIITPDNLKMIGIYREEMSMVMNAKHWHNNELDAIFILQHDHIDIKKLKKQRKEVQDLKFIHIDELEKEWTSWSDEKIAQKYTPKPKEYRNMVITEIRKALKSVSI